MFRVASHRVHAAELLEGLSAQGFRTRPLDGLPSFFVVESGPRPLSHTYEHWSGLLYVQQASTGLAAPALSPARASRVLDLCSSPGGKLTHLAQLVGEDGSLVACEIDGRRMRGLLGNVNRLCVPNVLVIDGDGRSFPAGPTFDHVLVDAPCSGEGTLRRRSGEVPDQSRRFLAYVTRAQRALLERAVALVRPGGTILYVTCTFSPEENEAVVSELLATAPVDLVPLTPSVPHAPGLTRFEGTTYDARLEGAVRIYPHHLDSGGLFMAKLRRTDGDAEVARDGWRPVPHAFPGGGHEEADAARLIDGCLEAVRARYDLDPTFVQGCRWILRGDTIWAHRLRDWPLESWEAGSWRAVSVGIRALEIDARGRPLPTNDFLRFASGSVRGGTVDVEADTLVSLLRGDPDDRACSVPGPVALRYHGDVVGRGRCGEAGLSSEIPKARAQDLLRALAASAP
ncbi:MAG: RsmB/NOP family class I SAM-dependent RNA methyltransferase [Gemmatimonadales bacterium]